MKLSKILEGLEYSTLDCIKDLDIEDIHYDSRKCKENTIFVAIKGESLDGHKFIEKAYEKNCRVFIVEQRQNLPNDTIQIEVENSRLALSKISSNFFLNPSKDLKIIGITGTKGKTTTSNIIKKVIENAGYQAGVIGTNGIFYKNISEPSYNTTPESYELHRIFRDMINEGVEYVVMEVSSGGLMMDRVKDVEFDIGVFTNISEDHIGPKEHPDFEDYLYCKSKLFNLCKVGIVNRDDKNSDYIINNGKCKFITYSIDKPSDYRARNIEKSVDLDHLGVKFDILNENYIISSPGKFSVYNALSVIVVSKVLNIEKDIVKNTLKNIHVDGRVEIIKAVKRGTVILDYAHNKTSLLNILDTLREYNPKRLMCLIGSVGGRGISRRYEIGEVISEKCDICILTSDNPDFEDPNNIIKDIEKGFVKNVETIKNADRKTALTKALDIMEDGDILLVAGKGHETYQLIKGERIEYSDREVIKDYFKE